MAFSRRRQLGEGGRRSCDEDGAVAADGDGQRLGLVVHRRRPRSWAAPTGTPTVSSGAEIMKMISSTSITSTSGVTLISDSACRRGGGRAARPRRRDGRWPAERPWLRPRAAACGGRLAQAALGHGRGQVVGEALQPAGELARVGRELVVGDIGRDGRDQADGGGEQGLGDGRAPPRPGWCSSGGRWPGRRVMMPQTVPNRPMNGRGGGDDGQAAQAVLHLARSRGR